MIEGHAGAAVADDGIVAAAALEFVEAAGCAVIAGIAGVGAAATERRGIVAVGEVRSPDGLHRAQRVGTDIDSADHRSVTQIDGYACIVSRMGVARTVESCAAVDEIVAAEAFEIFRGLVRVVAAGEVVVEEAAADLVYAP